MRPNPPASTSALRDPRALAGAPVEVGGRAPARSSASRPGKGADVPAALLRVVSGPGAGDFVTLRPGRHAVGSAPACAVRLEDPSLPAVAVTLVVGENGEVSVDVAAAARGRRLERVARSRRLPGPALLPPPPVGGGPREVSLEAAPAMVRLGGRPLRRRSPWSVGVQLAVGEVLLERDPPGSSPPRPWAEGERDVVRTARVAPAPRTSRFVLPEQPPEGGRWTRQGRASAAGYREQVRATQGRAREALRAEARARTTELPDPAQVLRDVLASQPAVWRRRRGDHDWLVLRAGTGDVPSEVSLLSADRRRVLRRWSAPDVPVTVDLDRAGVVGLAGPAGPRRRLAAWLVAQIAAHHSPADLRISLLTPVNEGPEPAGDAEDPWVWARSLPHLRPVPHDPGPFGLRPPPERAPSAPGLPGELDRLTDLMRARQAQARTIRGELTFDPVVVVMDAADDLRVLPATLTLLKEGPAVGFRFLWVDADPGALPRECGTTVVLTPPVLAVAVAGAPVAELARPDLPAASWFATVAGAIAPMREVAAPDEVALPTQARLLDLLGLDEPSGQRILHGWVVGGGRTTTAVLGEGVDGPFRVDLRRDGPHALVAGEWGSGKSELLQTLIASLAVGNRPDELSFVLFDYQGDGASGGAFGDCARLPHTAGVITDLDAHRTARVLESLAAELGRRQRLLVRASVKDLDDYQAARDAALLHEGRAGRLAPGHPLAEAIPRLVLVIDEFAALADDLPDFLSGLVDIARLGRSRGIHLILATERPAGVLSEEIAATTRLRVALRLSEPADSADVVDATDAARIPRSLPGRGFARLGESALFAFQAARVAGVAPGPHRGRAPRTDLAQLVDAVRDAAAGGGLSRAPAPWLPPLPDVVAFSDLPRRPLAGTPHPPSGQPRVIGAERRARTGTVAPLRFGLADVPSWQHQDVAVYDLARAGHLLVAGAPGSGRTTLLRALGASLAEDTSPDDVRLFVVDTLDRLPGLAALPHLSRRVGAGDGVRGRDDLAQELLTEIAARRDALTAQRLPDVREQRLRAPAGQAWPYLLVLVDAWEQALVVPGTGEGVLAPPWREVLARGGPVGVRVVLAGAGTGAAVGLESLVEDMLLLTGACGASGPAAPAVDALVGPDLAAGVAALAQDVPVGRAVRTRSPAAARRPVAGARAGDVRGTGGGERGRDGDRRRPAARGRAVPPHEVQVALLAADPESAAQEVALTGLAEAATRRREETR